MPQLTLTAIADPYVQTRMEGCIVTAQLDIEEDIQRQFFFALYCKCITSQVNHN